jgi:hypothetical protein
MAVEWLRRDDNKRTRLCKEDYMFGAVTVRLKKLS